MRSLRARLILGTALIALLPLAVTTFVLSRRLENMVRAQAEERLESAYQVYHRQIDTWRTETDKKLHILARDPVLRRLYLVSSNGIRDLSEYLGERRALLGLDCLVLNDTGGNIVVQERRGDWEKGLPVHSGPPVSIEYEHREVGYLSSELLINQAFLMELKVATGVDFSVGELASTSPAGVHLGRVVSTDMVRAEGNGEDFFARLVSGAPLGWPSIIGYISTTSSDRTITALQHTSILLGLIGLGMAILLGSVWSSQVSRPVERLADFSRKVAEGNWDEPLQVHSVKELETLVTALDRMRRDLTAYRERLITSERHAAWSQMARKVAHEVKNPLTPIAVSVADLKRSYEQNRDDFPAILDQAARTISEEVERLKRMLNEFSEFGRLPPPRFETVRMDDLFTDLTALYASDVRTGRLVLEPPSQTTLLHADPAQMRQALVNLLQNSFDALNGDGHVVITSRPQDDHVEISVADDGPGLSPEQRQKLFSPGFTTKPGGSGLGLVMVERIVNDHQGSIAVKSEPGNGTTFTLRLPRAIEREHAVRPDRG